MLPIEYGILSTGSLAERRSRDRSKWFGSLCIGWHNHMGAAGYQMKNSAGKAPKSTVLLIHQDPGIRDEITSCLVGDGYAVHEAAGGAEGLQLMYQVHPALILLDLTLLPSNAWDTLARMRLFTDTPVMLLVQQASPSDHQRGQVLGSIEFLECPFLPDKVRSAVKAQLEHVAGVPICPERHLVEENRDHLSHVS